MAEKIEGLYNKTDPLYVSTYDKVVGYAACAGIVVAIALVFPYRQHALNFVLSALIFVWCSINALIPAVPWQLEKFRLSFRISGADDAEPSDFYRIGRKIEIMVYFVLAGMLAAAPFIVA